eukprot:scaffold22351_cov126-Isochrysis_galbana.AAC.6
MRSCGLGFPQGSGIGYWRHQGVRQTSHVPTVCRRHGTVVRCHALSAGVKKYKYNTTYNLKYTIQSRHNTSHTAHIYASSGIEKRYTSGFT